MFLGCSPNPSTESFGRVEEMRETRAREMLSESVDGIIRTCRRNERESVDGIIWVQREMREKASTESIVGGF